MTIRPLFALAAMLATLFFSRTATAEGKHIRIVLDTSQSMVRTKTAPQGNDPRRLAVLSALLLYDLAQPNLTKGDTFRVIPFKTNWPAPTQGGPVPTGVDKILEPDQLGSSGDAKRARAVLADALRNLKYDAQNTYFAPGLEVAATDLDKTDCSLSTCVVILLTDGLPEAPTRDREAKKLRDDILPRLAKKGATFYALAFGSDIQDPNNKSKDFFNSVLGSGGTGASAQLGQLLTDPTGEMLPKFIVQIFSESFGYDAEGPKDLTGPQDFVLADTDDNQAAAVVLFQLDKTPPKWELGAPPTSKHTAQPLWEGDEVGASYSMQWFLRPDVKVPYKVEPRSGGVPKAMVLRPARLDIDIRVRPPAKKLLALGGRKFPLEIVVKPSYGTGAPSGLITIEYNEAGEDVNEGGGWKKFTWTSPINSPQAAGQRNPDGLVFPVDVNFEAPPKDRASYIGHLEVRAFRNRAPVATRRADKAFPVEVYPSVQVGATPDRLQVNPPALEKKKEGCALFRLVPDPKQPLPHPQSPKYKVRARIVGLKVTPALDYAKFTLDGKPLEVEGMPGGSPVASGSSAPSSPASPTSSAAQTDRDWYLGAERPAAEVFDPHVLKVCVIAGKPGKDETVDIPIVFSFAEAPYDEVRDVFSPVTVKATFVAPGAVARWAPWTILGLGPLLLFLGLYYLRHRPDLPSDLRVAIGPQGGALTPQKLGEGSLARRLLGLVRDRHVLTPDGTDVLGWVRPVEGDLYLFRAAEGAVSAADPADRPQGGEVPSQGVRIHVHRRYQVGKSGHLYDFQLEYER